MKKFIYFALFFHCITVHFAYPIKPLITKSTQAHYSGLSGRRYHIPRPSAPIISTHEPQYLDTTIVHHDYDLAEALAHERNQAYRDQQLERSSRRTYGSYGYHASSITEPLIHFLEAIFFKVPLMKQVYGGIKQLVHAFNIQDEIAFKKIVMVPFPTAHSYSIGFLTSEMPPQVIHFKTERFFNVFIPTTPNPTSGFLIQVAEKDIVVINLTRQEAMSLIISGGIIQPDRFKK